MGGWIGWTKKEQEAEEARRLSLNHRLTTDPLKTNTQTNRPELLFRPFAPLHPTTQALPPSPSPARRVLLLTDWGEGEGEPEGHSLLLALLLPPAPGGVGAAPASSSSSEREENPPPSSLQVRPFAITLPVPPPPKRDAPQHSTPPPQSLSHNPPHTYTHTPHTQLLRLRIQRPAPTTPSTPEAPPPEPLLSYEPLGPPFPSLSAVAVRTVGAAGPRDLLWLDAEVSERELSFSLFFFFVFLINRWINGA